VEHIPAPILQLSHYDAGEIVPSKTGTGIVCALCLMLFVVEYRLSLDKEATMRKSALLMAVLVMGLVAGCGVEMPSPVPTATPTTAPTSPPPTSVPEATDATPPASEASSGSASCVATPFDFPVESRVPPISEDDYTHGSADAPITLIEYADFQ
jgi:hypothetical protein